MQIKSNLPLTSTKVRATLLIETDTNELTPQELDYINSISQTVLRSVDKIGGSVKHLLGNTKKAKVTPRPKESTPRPVGINKNVECIYTYPSTKEECQKLFNKIDNMTDINERLQFLKKYGVKKQKHSYIFKALLKKRLKKWNQ